MRVLVVEDEEGVGDVFVDYLIELGHQPILVRSAEAALGRLGTERPDAIILDVNLPGMSGLEFLQLGRVRDLGVPIVAVSGVATESQARECLRLGALDFVGKPVPLERLSDVLDCVAPLALERREGRAGRPERRRSPRATIALPVRVSEYSGREWQGASLTLSPHAVKLRPRDRVQPGTAVRLDFPLPDGGPPVTVTAVLTREDPEGPTYFFVNLSATDSQRVRDLIARSRPG
jgi:DNA-binding response OmpR family regulator